MPKKQRFCSYCKRNVYGEKNICGKCRWERWYNTDEYRQKKREWAKIFYKNLKEEMIANYGGKCVCCGESEHMFLTIDHIYGKGTEERRLDKKLRGYGFYRELKKLGWPKDKYRILCYNCNCCIGVNGWCPHGKC